MTEHLETDLGTAAFLVAKGHRLLGLQDLGGRWAFRFENEGANTEHAALGYLQGDSVSARDILAAHKQLKTLLFKQRDYSDSHRKTTECEKTMR